MSKDQLIIKRIIDLICSALLLLLAFTVIILLYILVIFNSKQSGFYKSTRIGKHGRPFIMWKIRTMENIEWLDTTVTTSKDPRITAFGRFLRRTKLDELPQLWNVLKGDMSLVGPRPDVSGFADKLQGEDRKVLTIRPGITGLATLAFRNEEKLLAKQKNPERYNRKVIWPEKVRINKLYIDKYSLLLDFKILFKTIFGGKFTV